MRRIAGNLVIALGIVLIAVTFLWVIVELLEFSPNANEDQRGEATAGLLFAAVLVILGTVLCLAGRYSRQSSAVAGAEEVEPPGKGLRPWSLALYLGGSVVVALAAAFLHKAPESLRPLWGLVGQPLIFGQILFGGPLGIRLGSGIMGHIVPVGFCLLYYLALFYPLWRILTMGRIAEPLSYRRMKTLLILLGSVHLLITAAFSILIKA